MFRPLRAPPSRTFDDGAGTDLDFGRRPIEHCEDDRPLGRFIPAFQLTGRRDTFIEAIHIWSEDMGAIGRALFSDGKDLILVDAI
jgi:hypothetical protein